MAISSENAVEMYHRLGRLIEAMPAFGYDSPLTEDDHLWLGRADTLIAATGDRLGLATFRTAIGFLRSLVGHENAVRDIRIVLYRCLARAETFMPAEGAGKFIPAGNFHDAFAAIDKIVRATQRDVLVVDAYLDATFLTDFAPAIPEGIGLRLLADEHSLKPSLAPAATKFVAQYGARRPLQVRVSPPRALRDRAIFMDGAEAWSISQSFAHFANRSPGEVIRNTDTAAEKIAAYEAIWAASKPLT